MEINKKIAVILQPFGLGDCIFAQGIAQYYIRMGYRIYWPVIQQYVGGLRRAYPDINWMDEDFYTSDPRVRADLLQAICIPIRHSNRFMDCEYKDVMKAKYDMYNLDWKTWRNHAQWKADMFKERELMDVHGINPGDKYNLISRDYGIDPIQSVTEVDVNNGYKNVFVKQIDGYSLFDWAMMMRNATTIHMVASSNIFLLEMSNLKAEEICLYPRLPKTTNHDQYVYILEKHKYILK